MSIPTLERTAETSVPVLDAVASRWSPRAYHPESPVDEQKLSAALEAARWAPSAFNGQPWRFAVARRGSELHSGIVATLAEFNQLWAPSASVLIVAIAETASEDGTPITHAAYDLGQAVANLAIQAHHDGLHVHQMSGFDSAAAARLLELDARFVPFTVIAIGELGDASALPETLAARETAPRARRPLTETVIADA